jgi:integrase
MITTTVLTRRALEGPAVLKTRQVRALLAAPDRRTRMGRRDAALLAVLALGAVRVGEACRLTIDSVEAATGGRVRVTVRNSKQRAGASPTYRLITIPPSGAAMIKTYIDHDHPRFWLFGGNRNEALTTRSARRIVTCYLREIGRGDLHCHSLRHSCLSILVRETGSIYMAQKMAGHKDPRTTSQFYARYDVSDSDRCADALTGALSRRGRSR